LCSFIEAIGLYIIPATIKYSPEHSPIYIIVGAADYRTSHTDQEQASAFPQ